MGQLGYKILDHHNNYFTVRCFIADFGFAKHLYRGDELHALRGSPLYMAPEIICKGMYDGRVDLWSIGVILYGRLMELSI